MFTLPSPLPAIPSGGGSAIDTTFVDTGGYDVLIGGYGFRLATDTTNPYVRASEDTTAHRFDSSLEPGEQTLANLPWVKSQASFHAGAGQLNLEQGFTAFQYQQEQVEHIRFDISQGVDVWTPGQVTRLPDCKFTANTLTGGTGSATTPAVMLVSASGKDTLIVGSTAGLQQIIWNSGPDATPTINACDLTVVNAGGAANCKVQSVCTDGTNYYALVQDTTDGSSYIIKGVSGSLTAPTVIYNASAAASYVTGVVGWAKARLMAGVGNALYELNPNASSHSTMPTAVYTHPVATWSWNAVSESPSGILFAGSLGNASNILELSLSSAGGTPTLSGGTVVGRLPIGEHIVSMVDVVGSFIAVGTSEGVRIGTYDTYTGALKIGPLTASTPNPVYCLTTRDRFVYAGYTAGQPDGNSGLLCIDTSMIVDAAGRNAYAPGIRPLAANATTAIVGSVHVCPVSMRLVYTTDAGVYVEGGVPGNDGDSYLRTSRIRYDTVERKVFKQGRVRGEFDSSQVKIVGLTPLGTAENLGEFGFSDLDPGDFGLPGLQEWIQLEIHLIGTSCTVNSYQVKAYPAPVTPELITFTVNCFQQESDRYNEDVVDAETPRQRYQHLRDLKSAGDEITLVEFTNTAPVVTRCIIDALQLQSQSPPNPDTDFGGLITIRLRTTENS